MSSIKLESNPSGTGVFTLASPNSNTNRTLTLPNNTGTILTSATTTGFPAGSVIQVAQTVKTDTFFTSSTSYLDITGATVSITPTSTSSKILVSAQLVMASTTTTAAAYVAVAKGGTLIGIGGAAGSRVQAGGVTCLASSNTYAASGGIFLHFLDSPNTTSSTTYSIQVKNQSSYSLVVGRQGDDTDSDARGRFPTIITVMEIAG